MIARMGLTHRQIQTAVSVPFQGKSVFHASFLFEISSLDDIQTLTAKDLQEILRSHSESMGGMKADLVLKVYALLMRDVLPSSANNTVNEDGSLQDQGNFKSPSIARNEFPPAIRLPHSIHAQIPPHCSQRNTL